MTKPMEMTRSQLNEHAEEILSIIRGGSSPLALREKLEDYHENDIAAVLPELREAERKKLCRVLDPGVLSDIISYLDEEEDAAALLAELDVRRAVEVVSRMEPDDAVPLLRNLSRESGM